MRPADLSGMAQLGRDAAQMIPQPEPDIVEWAKEHVCFPKSTLGSRFDDTVCPQVVEPLRRQQDVETRGTSLVKPVQTCGSGSGEAAVLFWSKFRRGIVQYNWPTDEKADGRWESRFEDVVDACGDGLGAEACSLPPGKRSKGQLDLGRVFFRMQGVFNPDNLDSDSVNYQCNEEVHAWEAGHLAKSRARQTAVWNRKFFDISNAGNFGGELHMAFEGGTRQRWEVRCPGCGLFHIMRTKWEPDRPHLGGLRYDSEKAFHRDGTFSYEALASTLRHQLPCGFEVRDDQLDRKQLSMSGRYSDPAPGSDPRFRSYTYEAVSVDFINWIDLIKQKHEALRAHRAGDPEPYRIYCIERECEFYDPNKVRMESRITIVSDLKKNRKGLPEPRNRFFELDRQGGKADDFSHWWMTIRDAKVSAETGLVSQLVFEGRVDTDAGVLAVLQEYECHRRWLGVADSSYDTTHVNLFCLQNGINSIKGTSALYYPHPSKLGAIRRCFSPERPLWQMVSGHRSLYPMRSVARNNVMVKVPDPREPLFWLYSKDGISERLHFIRTRTDYRTPDDVSQEYRDHQEAKQRIVVPSGVTKERVARWLHLSDENHLLVCEEYFAMQVDQAGMIFPRPGQENQNQDQDERNEDGKEER